MSDETPPPADILKTFSTEHPYLATTHTDSTAHAALLERAKAAAAQTEAPTADSVAKVLEVDSKHESVAPRLAEETAMHGAKDAADALKRLEAHTAKTANKAVAASAGKFTEVAKKAWSGKLLTEAPLVKDAAGKAAGAGEQIFKQGAYDKLGFVKKTTAGIAGNLRHGGLAGRTVGILGSGATIYFGGGLLMDAGRLIGIVPQNKDSATGKEQEVGFGTILFDAGATAVSLLIARAGGGKYAMGIAGK